MTDQTSDVTASVPGSSGSSPADQPGPAVPLSHDGAPQPAEPPETGQKPGEIGGPRGPEPTRYGDWESNGRCTDF